MLLDEAILNSALNVLTPIETSIATIKKLLQSPRTHMQAFYKFVHLGARPTISLAQ